MTEVIVSGETRLAAEVAAMIYEKIYTSNEFRLLWLMPGAENDPIECHLSVSQLDKKPQYEAMSYRWGDSLGHNVFCNEQYLPVNANLYAALQRFRLLEKPRSLWVDEICVNQDDPKDRGQQVKIFNRIYAGATNVLIWLGPESVDSDVAMDFFPRMMNHLSDKRSKQEITDPDLPSVTNAAYRTPKMVALNNLFSRDWFSRVWTLQEAALAPKAVVVCGSKEFPFRLFEDFNSNCQQDDSGVWSDTLSSITSAKPVKFGDPPRFATAHLHDISKLKRTLSGMGVRESVPMLLSGLRSCGAKDDRDRIYSLWSFLPPEYLNTLKEPRYEKEYTATDLYYQIAQIELIHNQNLDFLGEAGLWQQRPNLSLPSWVADWSYRKLTHPLWIHDQDCLRKTGACLYRASGDVLGRASISEMSKILRVEGKVLGKINDMTDPVAFSTNSGTNKNADPNLMFLERMNLIDICFAKAAQCHPYHQNIDAQVACKHTLTASLKKRGLGSVLGDTLIRTTDEDLEALYSDFETAKAQFKTSGTGIYGIDMTILRRVFPLFGVIQEMMRTRRFIVTEDKYVGFVPGMAKQGDSVAVIFGCLTPVVLRKVDKGNWKLVGDCYIHGMMNGEAARIDDSPATEIRLV